MMKVQAIIICLVLIIPSGLEIYNVSINASALTFLLNDFPISETAPVPDDYQFDVLSEDHAVVGIRSSMGDDFDLEVYEDSTFSTLIESSTSAGDMVDFVVLDKNTWAGPPSRGARVTKGTTNYVIEMENDVDDYSVMDTWGGSMDYTPGNPVLDLGPPGSWDDNRVYGPTVVYEGGTYHMWYEGRDGTNYGIGYATSSDRITWTKSASNPVITPGPSSWDSQALGHPAVIYDGTTYQMWYGGNDGSTLRIGYATSLDGITWTKYAGNPVLDVGPSGSWDDYIVQGPTVLYDGVTYQMWYHGHDDSNYRIGYATSPDGVTWAKPNVGLINYGGNKNNNIVLDLGTSGLWDDTHVAEPTVLYDSVTYQMWYAGGDGSNTRIGYAASPDGITWTKNPVNPVLDIGSPGTWDDSRVGGPTVLHDGTTYHMWYAGRDGGNLRIGYATSSGMNAWKKSESNPALDLGLPGSWDGNYAYLPVVLYDGITYRMWYSGWNGAHRRLGYASSSDGITWTKHPSNPVLDLGPPGSWDEIHAYSPSVIYDGTTYHMWYTGADNTYTYRIGYASSMDGITWTKSPSNPVLDLGSPGSWDNINLHSTTVLYDEGAYHMWYGGDDGLNWMIGYATSLDGITWTRNPANPVLDLGPPGSWDDTHTQFPSVLYDGITYHMWYTGKDGTTRRLGYAISSDGVSWVKSEVNPVLKLGPPGSWDDYDHAFPTVLYDGTTYHMWYGGKDGTNYRIGYATSPDINKWTKLTSFTEILDAYEITDINAGFTNTITLEVPSTADLDLFIFDTTGSRSDAVASSTNTGAGIDEFISFTATATGHYLLVITNEDGGTGIYTIIGRSPPVADAGLDQTVNEGDEVLLDGSGSIGGGSLGITPPAGLVSWWPGDENANDIVDGNHGTLQGGATFTAGKVGQAFSFDGLNDYIKVLDSANLDITGDLTIDAWIKADSITSTTKTQIVSKWNNIDGERSYLLDIKNGKLRFSISTDGSTSWEIVEHTITSGEWHLVAGVFRDSDNHISLYVDGEQVSSKVAGVDSIYSTQTNLLIGAQYVLGSPGRFFEGIIDEVEIFNRALSESEIQALYNAGSTGKCKDPGGKAQIVSYEWDFESDGIYDYLETLDNAPDGAFDGMTTHIYGDNGVYMATLRITDDTQANDTDACNITVNNVQPTVNWTTTPSGCEGSPITFTSNVTDPGSDDLTFTWNWGDGASEKVTTYYNDGIGPDPYPSPSGFYPFSAIDTVDHPYGDNGFFTVTLTVEDDDGGVAIHSTNITVLNINPIAIIEGVYMDVEIGLRVAGRKYNNVDMRLYGDGNQVGYVSIERLPGSPNDQMAWISIQLDMTKTYNATVIFTPEDPPDIGANPVWIYIKFKNGSIKKIHHTFNVQQSKKRDSDHWNHVEPWEVDLNNELIGCQFNVTSYVTDPGSDDITLTYTYGSQIINIIYLNCPPNPDPYPSPEINPRNIKDTTAITCEGSGTLSLLVEDDDGGTSITSKVLA